MKKSEFIGKRLAEFQFGRNIFGYFQFLWFMPVYFKMFNLKLWQIMVASIGLVILIWLVGLLCYKFGIVRNFRKHEFKGIIK